MRHASCGGRQFPIGSVFDREFTRRHTENNLCPCEPVMQMLKHILGIVQSIATIVALVIGGVWALYIYNNQREAKPHLNIDHEITSILLSPEYRLIHISVIHENRGNTLIELNKSDIRLQQIMPLSESISKKLTRRDDSIINNCPIIGWPLLCRRLSSQNLELEPNETHESITEFIIPSYVSVVKIYTYYPNKEKDAIGWANTTIYDVEDEENRDEIQLREGVSSPHICARNIESVPN